MPQFSLWCLASVEQLLSESKIKPKEYITMSLLWIFGIGFCYVAQAGLKHLLSLP